MQPGGKAVGTQARFAVEKLRRVECLWPSPSAKDKLW